MKIIDLGNVFDPEELLLQEEQGNLWWPWPWPPLPEPSYPYPCDKYDS